MPFAKKKEHSQDWYLGSAQGQEDGADPTGVMMHLRARRDDLWAEASDDYRAGYEAGWELARSSEPF